MRLETLVLELMADSSQLNQSVDNAINKAAQKIKSLEGKSINIKAPIKDLLALDAELIQKQKDIKETARVANSNPIVVRVDGSQVKAARKELKGLKDDLGDFEGSQEIKIKVEHEYKQSTQSNQSNQKSSNQEDGTLFQEMEQKVNGKIKEVINKVGGVVTAPFAGIGRGFFEGFGQSISKELSKGFMGSLDKELNVNLKTAGKKAANATIDYFGGRVKKAKSDAKEIEKIHKEVEKTTQQKPQGQLVRLAKDLGQGGLSNANKVVRGVAPAITGMYGVAKGAENVALSVIPYGHVLKKLAQVGAVVGGLPLAASAMPALAPVAGMLGMAHGAGGAMGGAMAAGHMGSIASIPVIGGQVAGLLTSAASGLGGVVTEMAAAALAVNAVAKGTQILVGNALEDKTKQQLKAIAPSMNYVEEQTTKTLKGIAAKAQNLDKYLPTLPESHREAVRKYLPIAAQMQDANKGKFIPANVGLTGGLKALAPADYKKLDEENKNAVKNDLVSQYKAAQKLLHDFSQKVAETIPTTERMMGDIGSIRAALKRGVTNLEKQADKLRIDIKPFKVEESNFKGVTLDVKSALPDLKHSSDKTAKSVNDNWRKTEKDVSKSMVEITETAKEQSYPLKKAMSEGSPGPTFWIRENWRKTADFVKNQIKSIAEPANQLFNSGQKNVGKINIPNKTGIDPDLLKRQQWSKLVTIPNTSLTNPKGIVSPPLPVMSPDEIKKAFGGNTTKTLNEIPKKLREKADTELGKGTVEYYDNFLGNIKKTLASRMGGGGNHGDHLADQIMTFLFAGASTISPQLGPMLAAAPLFMPLIPAAIATLGIANLIAPAIGKIDQALKQQQPIDQRFQTLAGSAELGQAKRREIVGLSEKYTTSAEKGTENYTQMAIASRGTNLTDGEMKGLYEGISASIRALNLDTQDAGLIFMAYTQMLSKGKISMEELRQQLGERFPPAMSVFAKALGTSTAGLEELISRGAVSTEQWVPKVTKVLKEDFGGAALAMGDSYTSAITKIENTNFALNKNFSDTYGGLFATVTNAWGGVLAAMNGNFKILNALAISSLIAVGASIAIGLTYILKMPAINNFMVGGTSILLSTFKFSLKTLTPFLIGTLADVMDDVFGAKNNVFENMSKGVGNFFAGVFGGIDKSVRNSTGTSLFDPFKVKENPFAPMLKGIDELKQKLGGFVELAALVLMFEQVRVLGSMFLMPLFKSMAGATLGWGKAIKEALLNKDTGLKTIGDLFGGTLIGLTGVNREGTIKKNKAEFDELRKQQKALAQDNPLANFGRARQSFIETDMENGFSRRQSLEARKAQFDEMARQMGVSVNAQGRYLPNIENDPLVRYHKRRDELLTRRMRQESRARALAFTANIALEAGLALGIMSFAKGDFSNNLGGELNKAKTKMIAAIDGMKVALNGLKGTAKEVGTALGGIKLPSKGAQLDIRNILGDDSKDYKWDDLINDINKQGLGAAKSRQALTSTLQFLTGSDKGTIGAGIAEYVGIPDVSNIDKNIKDSQRIGLKDYYVQDKNMLPTMAQDQLLNFGKDLEKLQGDIKAKLKNNAFDINDLSKPLSSEYKSLINEVNAIDKKLEGKGAKRLELATINTTQSRKEIAALDIEINALSKERKDKVTPFSQIEDNIKDWKSSLKTISETIASDPSIPSAAKRALNSLLKPSIDTVNQVSDYLKGQGIGKLAQPLMDVWDSVINKLKDVDLALQKLKTGNEKAFAQAQIKLYKSNLGTNALSPALQKESLKDLQNQESLLQQTIDKKQALLNQALRLANVGDTSEKKAKIEEVKKEILDASKELDGTRVSIAKSLYEINNNFIAEDALRNYKRSLEDWNLDMKRQAIDAAQQIESYRREVEDAGIQFSRENRDLAESFSDLMLDLQTQLKTAKNEFIDIQDKIKNTQFKRAIAELSPFDNSIGKKFANIFASLFEKLRGSESESRKLEMEQEQIGKSYVDTLRKIRGEQEKQFDAEKNRTRALVDMANRSVKFMMDLQQTQMTNMRKWDDLNKQNNRENRGQTKFEKNPYSNPQTLQPPVIKQSTIKLKPITVEQDIKQQIGNKKLQSFNFGVPKEFENIASTGGMAQIKQPNIVAGNWFTDRLNEGINFVQSGRKGWNLENWKKEYKSRLKKGQRMDLAVFANWLKLESEKTGNVNPAVLAEIQLLNRFGEKQELEYGRKYSEALQKSRKTTPSNATTPKVNIQSTTPQRVKVSTIPTAVVPLEVLNAQLKKLEIDKSLTSNITGKILTLRKKMAEDWLFMVAQIYGIDKRLINETAVNAVNTGKLGKTFKFAGVNVSQQDFEGYAKMSPAVRQEYIKLYQSGKLKERYLAELKANQPIAKSSNTKLQNTTKKTQTQSVQSHLNEQSYQPIQPPVYGGYTPINPSAYGGAYDNASQIYTQQKENIELKKVLTAEDKALALKETTNQLINGWLDVNAAIDATNNSIREQGISATELIQNGKGYLTVQEQIAKVGNDIDTQYIGMVRTIKSQITELDKEKRGLEGSLVLINKEIDAAIAEGIMDKADGDTRKAENEINMKRTEQWKALQIKALKLTQKELEGNKDINSELGKQINLERINIEASKMTADLQSNVANAQYNQGGSLINRSGIIKAKSEVATAEFDARERGKGKFNTNAELENYVKLSKELADINLAQAYTDAIPGLNQFTEALGGVIKGTTTWRDGLKSVLDAIADVVLQTLVLNPIKNSIGSFLGQMFGNFAQGTDYFVPNYAGGLNPIDMAMNRERAASGRNPQLAVINEGEVILSANNKDAELWRSLKANGDWDNLKATVPNYAQGNTNITPVRSQSSGGVTIVQNWNVTTPDANSFKKSQARMDNESAARLRRTTQR